MLVFYPLLCKCLNPQLSLIHNFCVLWVLPFCLDSFHMCTDHLLPLNSLHIYAILQSPHHLCLDLAFHLCFLFFSKHFTNILNNYYTQTLGSFVQRPTVLMGILIRQQQMSTFPYFKAFIGTQKIWLSNRSLTMRKVERKDKTKCENNTR